MAIEAVMFNLGLLIIIAAALSLILKKINQPPLVAYLVTGILAASLGLGLTEEYTDLIIEIGIVLLLFIAGLEIKLKDIVKLGKKTFIIGEGHDILMAIVGFIIALFCMKIGTLAAIYVAIGVTLSSTIVVVKALTQRKELASPHGKILVGTMVLQDLVAMLFLAIVTGLDSGANLFANIGITLFKIALLVMILYIAGKLFMSVLFNYAARRIELVFVIGLAWCFAGVALAHLFHVSIAIGAFIAGIAISHLPFTFELTDKMRALQDFGIMLFFISVGTKVQLSGAFFTSPWFYVLTLFVFLFTPLVTGCIGSYLAFTKKETFIMSLMPTQISEFTLIILAVGVDLGHITGELFSMLTLIVIITIAASSSYLTFLNMFYKKVEKKIGFLEWHVHGTHHKRKKDLKDHVVIIGFKRLGQEIAHFYKEGTAHDIVVIEWHPELIKKAEKMKLQVVYGDAGDSDLWEEMSLQKAHFIVNTIGNNQEDDMHMLAWLKEKDSNAFVVVETNNEQEAKESYNAGADFVLVHDHLEFMHIKHHIFTKLKIKKKKKK